MKDLRTPIGIFFVILGLLVIAAPGAHAALTSAPVNLYSGLAMLGFGGVMLVLAFRKMGG
jgi:hypothetical protein